MKVLWSDLRASWHELLQALRPFRYRFLWGVVFFLTSFGSSLLTRSLRRFGVPSALLLAISLFAFAALLSGWCFLTLLEARQDRGTEDDAAHHAARRRVNAVFLCWTLLLLASAVLCLFFA